MLIYEKNKIIIKNLMYIYTLNEENITLKTKDNTIKIFGNNLEVDYLEYGEVHVFGNIKEIKLDEK